MSGGGMRVVKALFDKEGEMIGNNIVQGELYEVVRELGSDSLIMVSTGDNDMTMSLNKNEYEIVQY